MNLGDLPQRTVPLTEQGINDLLAQFNKTPEGAKYVMESLKANPKDTIYHLFALTPEQRSIIAAMPAANLARYTDVVLTVKFGAHKAPTVDFKPDPVFAGVKAIRDNVAAQPQFECHCHIDVGAAPPKTTVS